MSWSPHLCIGEFRPWPESIYVTRDKTDETRRYVPEKYDSAMQCLQSLENATLRDLVKDLWARRDSLLDFGFYAEAAEKLEALGIDVD